MPSDADLRSGHPNKKLAQSRPRSRSTPTGRSTPSERTNLLRGVSCGDRSRPGQRCSACSWTAGDLATERGRSARNATGRLSRSRSAGVAAREGRPYGTEMRIGGSRIRQRVGRYLRNLRYVMEGSHGLRACHACTLVWVTGGVQCMVHAGHSATVAAPQRNQTNPNHGVLIIKSQVTDPCLLGLRGPLPWTKSLEINEGAAQSGVTISFDRDIAYAYSNPILVRSLPN